MAFSMSTDWSGRSISCFATEAMQNCAHFGSLENPSILLSGLRAAVPLHCSVTPKAQTPSRGFAAPNQRRCDVVQRRRKDHRPISDRAPVHMGVDQKVHEPSKLGRHPVEPRLCCGRNLRQCRYDSRTGAFCKGTNFAEATRDGLSKFDSPVD